MSDSEVSEMNVNVPTTVNSPSMVVQQPREQAAGPVYMAAPQLIPGIPRGLEYIACVSSIAVHQLVEMLEVFTGIETRNRYSLCNEIGQQVYFAYEESSFVGRQYMGRNRGFRMNIMDNSMQIGRVVLVSSCGTLEYFVQDMAGNRKLFVRGGGCCAGGEVDYEVLSATNMAPVGVITKLWGGWAKEMYTDADSFIVKFPLNLDVNLKASLLGVTFLIDFIAYENKQQNRRTY